MPLRSLQAAASSNYGSRHSSQFPLLSLLPLPYKTSFILKHPFLHIPKPHQPCLSSSIGSKRASHFLFVVCCKVEEENKAETGIIPEEKSEDNANEAYLYSSFEDSSLDIDGLSIFNENDNNNQNHWEDVALGSKKKT